MKEKSTFLSTLFIRRRFFIEVALPTCQSLMDVLHKEASTLKHMLLSSKKRGQLLLPPDDTLYFNIGYWLDVITSTHIASLTILLDNNNHNNTNNNNMDRYYYEFQHELKPIGTSLEKLRDAMWKNVAISL